MSCAAIGSSTVPRVVACIARRYRTTITIDFSGAGSSPVCCNLFSSNNSKYEYVVKLDEYMINGSRTDLKTAFPVNENTLLLP